MRFGLGLGLGFSSQGALFLPTALGSALELWVRSDLGITLNAGAVSNWADQSGKGRDLAQATGANQPTYNATDAAYNNRPSIQAATTTHFLKTATFTTVNQPVSIFAVGEFSTAGAVLVTSAGASTPQIFDASGNTVGNAGASITDNVAHNTPRTFLFVANGASSLIGVSDWLTGGVSGNGGANTWSQCAVFAYPGGTFSTVGKITELIVLSRAATSADKTAMAAYFRNLYGITTT